MTWTNSLDITTIEEHILFMCWNTKRLYICLTKRQTKLAYNLLCSSLRYSYVNSMIRSIYLCTYSTYELNNISMFTRNHLGWTYYRFISDVC